MISVLLAEGSEGEVAVVKWEEWTGAQGNGFGRHGCACTIRREETPHYIVIRLVLV